MKAHLLIPLLLLSRSLFAQVNGCTDPRAVNYDANATRNNGSCQYDNTAVTPRTVCARLSDEIMETSGLIWYGQAFWTINDSGNPPVLYQFDSSSGQIKHKTYIKNEVNNDWEELTQDSLFIYIGDFGNNRGGRTDLRILKIRKSDLNTAVFTDTVSAEIIHFSMKDQTSFNHTGQNHDYDMEAFCSIGDSLHLFSKNWVDGKSRHYVCPKTPGTWSLDPAETLDVNGQVTGACYGNGVLVLTGYNKGGMGSFIYLMWDASGNRFMSGNRRRIDCGNVILPGQNEAVCFAGRSLYMSSEKQISQPALYRLYTSVYTDRVLSTGQLPGKKQIKVRVNDRRVIIDHSGELSGRQVEIIDYTGRRIVTVTVKEMQESIDAGGWAAGHYMVKSGQKVLAEFTLQ